MLDCYFGGTGLISVGAFYKNIDNWLYTFTTENYVYNGIPDYEYEQTSPWIIRFTFNKEIMMENGIVMEDIFLAISQELEKIKYDGRLGYGIENLPPKQYLLNLLWSLNQKHPSCDLMNDKQQTREDLKKGEKEKTLKLEILQRQKNPLLIKIQK